MSGAEVPAAEAVLYKAYAEVCDAEEGRFHSGWDETRYMLTALRALPVAERMEAMGMKPCAVCADGKHFMEAE